MARAYTLKEFRDMALHQSQLVDAGERALRAGGLPVDPHMPGRSQAWAAMARAFDLAVHDQELAAAFRAAAIRRRQAEGY